MEKLKMHATDKTEENYRTLAELFPQAITEVIDENGEVVRAIDADVLAQEINTHVVSGKEERYQFKWPDKKKSVLLANSPINATLRPCREESVDFDNTGNLYIEGDNLDVLKILRETYLNSVKMIYIDPPYNTGNDFIYEDDFAEGEREFLDRDHQYSEDGNRMVKNFDSNGRFHTDWLNMIYPRLKIARDLLAYDGVIFISIDDNEVENLKKICDEIFGQRNRICTFIRKSGISARLDAKFISVETDNVLMYAKDITRVAINFKTQDNDDSYTLEDGNVNRRGRYKLNKLDRGSIQYSPSLDYPITAPDGTLIYPGGTQESNGWCWRWSREKVAWGLKNDFIVIKKTTQWTVYFKQYQLVDNNDTPIKRTLPHKNLLTDGYFNENATKELKQLEMGVFDYPKPIALLDLLLQIASQFDSLILDFFSGSATTAHAVMRLNAEDGGNRKFIMVQLPEICDEKNEAFKAGYVNVCQIGKERMRRAGRQIQEKTKVENRQKKIDSMPNKVLDIGFRVLKLDSSNMKDVYYTPQEYTQFKLDGFVDNIKEDRTSEDLLFQAMLDLGVHLSGKIEERKIDGVKVFSVDNNYLVACFEKVNDRIVTEIARTKPYFAVFRDSSFDADATLVNFEQIFKTYSPDTIRKVL